jgi:hypothetical protein
MEYETPVSLVDLPDPCLLTVLRCLTDDPVSLFSAARAHSRLHQAAVVALSSITVDVKQQQHVDRVLLYLEQHGRHVSSVHLQIQPFEFQLYHKFTLRQLPANLQLTSLQLDCMLLQLQQGGGFQGVLRPGLPLKQLRLQSCALLDDDQGLAAAWQALLLLTGLEDLTISCHIHRGEVPFSTAEKLIAFPTSVLAKLQQLTCLVLSIKGTFQGPDDTAPALQPLQGLTRLAALKLDCWESYSVTANMLSCQLTRLELEASALQPDALAGKTQLQHLAFLRPGDMFEDESEGDAVRRSAFVAGLLSQLQHLTQLTYLDLPNHFHGMMDDNPPAAAFSALTASSKLQYLNISDCRVPEGVWQHVFPTDRQLPQLSTLLMDSVMQPEGYTVVPPGSRIVSCCPGLQSLDMRCLRYDAEQMAPLSGLSSLHTLLLYSLSREKGFEVVGQLPQLRHLQLEALFVPEGLLQHVTHLQQLTYLNFTGRINGQTTNLRFEQQVRL